MSVAEQLGDPAAAALLVTTAQHALTVALQATSVISAVVSVATVIAAAVYLRERKPASTPAALETCTA
jgi:hypothetical protein